VDVFLKHGVGHYKALYKLTFFTLPKTIGIIRGTPSS